MPRANIRSRPLPITREQPRCDSATWAVARRLDACYKEPGNTPASRPPPLRRHQGCVSPPPATSSSLDTPFLVVRPLVVSRPRLRLSAHRAAAMSIPLQRTIVFSTLLYRRVPDVAILALSPATFYYILASSVICQVCASSPLHHRSAAVADNDVDRISHDSSSAL